jgi:hypothetical protein
MGFATAVGRHTVQTASPFSRLLSRAKQLLCTLFFLLWGVYDCAVGPTRVRPVSSNGTEIYASSSNSVLASWRSAVSKPSVNQP